eukprot:gene1003-1971_t
MKLSMSSFFSPKTSISKVEKVVAISGATGLVGPSLTAALESRGYKVIPITTKKNSRLPNAIEWNPTQGVFDASGLEGVEAVINLAGENIASGEGPLAILGRWSDSKKSKILSSRVDSTRLLVEGISKLKRKPKVFISASGIGAYGYNDFDTVFDETNNKPGSGFLAEVCRAWEGEANKAKNAGVRVVCARFAAVLTPKGGVVGKLLPLFLIGGGGNLGSGKQPFSWVSLQDLTRALIFLLETPSISGPVNICAPDSNTATNEQFTQAFGRAINRPTIVPLPEFVAKPLFGQFGEELLLGGQKSVPKKLLGARFQFLDADITNGMVSVMKSK